MHVTYMERFFEKKILRALRGERDAVIATSPRSEEIHKTLKTRRPTDDECLQTAQNAPSFGRRCLPEKTKKNTKKQARSRGLNPPGLYQGIREILENELDEK